MKVTWLGQAGLFFENKSLRIMIDPYFSDSVQKINPQNYRRLKINEAVFSLKPNLMVFTHNHLDHYDPETIRHFINEQSEMTILAPSSVWNDVRKIGGNNEYVLFNRHTEWTEQGLRFTAVKAEHSDPSPIGVIIDDGEKKFYITGDTLYNTEIFEDIPKDIYALFLPINGTGNNMNTDDAKRFCEKIAPQFAVPIHWGMFDELDANQFEYENKIIPEIYKEVQFP